MIDVVYQANRNICVTLLRYRVAKPESSYDQVRLFAKKMEKETFQQIVYVNYKLEEVIYLLDVVDSVYDTDNTNEPSCNILWKVISFVYSFFTFPSIRWRISWIIEDNWNLFLNIKPKLGLYHVVRTTQNFLPKNLH